VNITNWIGSGFVSANQMHGIHHRLHANIMPLHPGTSRGMPNVNNIAYPTKFSDVGMQFAQDFSAKNSHF